MFDKLKLKHKGGDIEFCDPIAPPGKGPLKQDIYRNRQNFGVNLGSCFVQERWICHGNFPEGCQTELQMAQGLSKQKGVNAARAQLEEFWKNFMSQDDWGYLQDKGVTCVRIPVGYWNIDGGKFAGGTKFKDVAPIYENSWSILKSHFIEPAAAHNIGVLVDMHGLPGGANSSDHLGETCDQGAMFWGLSDTQLAMCKAFAWMARDLKRYENLAGIQVCNEAEYCNNPKLQGYFYAAAINAIREVDPTLPVIISDSWNAGAWTKWVQDKQAGQNTIGVVVDEHVYRCFSGEDHNKLPDEIIDNLRGSVLTGLDHDGAGVDFMIGEYLCVLDGQLWLKGDAQNRRDDLVIKYGRTQCEVFSERAKWGSFFWTYKFESGNGGEWDFRTMTDKGAIYCPFTLKGKQQLPDDAAFNDANQANYQQHVAYWDQTLPNEKFEHDLYQKGFTTGWHDALAFAQFDGSVLGRVQAWKLSRLEEHIHNHHHSKYEWEWEQGYTKGLAEFNRVARESM